MAYGRRTRRARTTRRGRRTLSTRNVFSNKGARAQAKQINALTKRVRSVYNRCKPEVKLVTTDLDNRGFGDAPRSLNYAMVQRLPTPSVGTSNSGRIGDIVKILPAEAFMTIQYEEVFESLRLGYSTTQIPLPTSGIQHRIIFVQSKIPSQSLSTGTLDQILDTNYYTLTPGEIEAQMSMKMPFVSGVTTNWHILYDRIVTVSRDNPQKALRLKIRPAMKSLRWFENSPLGSPAGSIYMIVLTSGWSAFKYDVVGGDPYYDFNKSNFSWMFRQPFTDA